MIACRFVRRPGRPTARATTSLFAAAALLLGPAALRGKPVAPPTLDGLAADTAPAQTDRALSADDDAPAPGTQFDTIAFPLPANLPSVGFEATATREFGDLVRLSGSKHFVDSVTVTMSSWAVRSDYPGASPLGFTHPITLKVYAVDRTTGMPRPGAVLANITQYFLVPWRPEPDPMMAVSPSRPWRAADGNYYTGLAST